MVDRWCKEWVAAATMVVFNKSWDKPRIKSWCKASNFLEGKELSSCNCKISRECFSNYRDHSMLTTITITTTGWTSSSCSSSWPITTEAWWWLRGPPREGERAKIMPTGWEAPQTWTELDSLSRTELGETTTTIMVEAITRIISSSATIPSEG